ncbi:hypothetical protein [Nocardioides sp.]|uniref:hypothetical protein n=1 Tax=Nocardioides sp. TaxID=35761 RepID=UPI0031FF0FEC
MKKRSTIGLAVVSMLALSIGAYAYWTNSGTGTGSAATGTTAGITVNQTSVVSGLYPGSPAQALSGNFDNGNAGPIHVASVTGTVTSTGAVGCSPADFVVSGSPAANVQEVPSGTGVGSWSGLSVAMTNTAANQDACKNATLTISYTSA